MRFFTSFIEIKIQTKKLGQLAIGVHLDIRHNHLHEVLAGNAFLLSFHLFEKHMRRNHTREIPRMWRIVVANLHRYTTK